MITLKQIVEINTNIKELKNLCFPFIFEISKILVNDLKVTNKILENEIENIKIIENKYFISDEYGERDCREGCCDLFNSELEMFYNNKTYDEKVIKFEYIYERDFKAREEYKSMRFDIKTMELLTPIIKSY